MKLNLNNNIFATSLTTYTSISSPSISADKIFATSTDVDTVVIDTSNDYTFSNIDNNKIIHFDTTTSTLTAIFPDGLKANFNCAIMNIGSNSIELSASTTFKSLGTTLSGQYAGAFIYKDGSNNIYAVGRF